MDRRRAGQARASATLCVHARRRRRRAIVNGGAVRRPVAAGTVSIARSLGAGREHAQCNAGLVTRVAAARARPAATAPDCCCSFGAAAVASGRVRVTLSQARYLRSAVCEAGSCASAPPPLTLDATSAESHLAGPSNWWRGRQRASPPVFAKKMAEVHERTCELTSPPVSACASAGRFSA
jgi:hypothetical protein